MFVYISNNDSASKTFLNDYLYPQNSDHSIADTVATNFVYVNLIKNTPDFASFQQIFPNLVSPSFYLVSKGQLLDVITRETDISAFHNRLQDVIQKQCAPSRDLAPANREPAPSHHEQSVRQYQRQLAESKKLEAEERKRIRALLEADKRERQSLKSLKIPSVSSVHPSMPRNYDTCSLIIRLFDGKSLKGQFGSHQTLNDVRVWLDEETNHSIVPNLESSMPAFAHSSTLQPTKYAFHCAGIPPTTFDDSEEFLTLADLKLCPRSALILKPIYDDAVFANYPQSRGSILGSIGGAIGKFTHALYSFFDYGVVNDNDAEITPVHSPDEAQSSAIKSIKSNDDVDVHPTKKLVVPKENEKNTPNILSIDNSRPSSASLINFEGLRKTQNQQHGQKEDSKMESRPNSPRLDAISRATTPPLGLLSMSRTQTIHNEASHLKDSELEPLAVDRD